MADAGVEAPTPAHGTLTTLVHQSRLRPAQPMHSPEPEPQAPPPPRPPATPSTACSTTLTRRWTTTSRRGALSGFIFAHSDGGTAPRNPTITPPTAGVTIEHDQLKRSQAKSQALQMDRLRELDVRAEVCTTERVTASVAAGHIGRDP